MPLVAPFAVAIGAGGEIFLWITAMAFPILAVSVFMTLELVRPLVFAHPSRHD